MGNLDELAIAYGSDKSSRLHNYAVIYERVLGPLKNDHFNLLEIGVDKGASIRMWLDFFPNAKIYGIDLENEHGIVSPRFNFIKGDQGDDAIWRKLGGLRPRVIIDDGSHIANDVLASFSVLWDRVEPGGYYIVEDVFCWFFYAIWDVTGIGKKWLGDLLSAVNMGGKYFYGNPGTIPPNQDLTGIERELESIEFQKGLAIMRKRIGQPNLQ